jgi:hypothetical protein
MAWIGKPAGKEKTRRFAAGQVGVRTGTGPFLAKAFGCGTMRATWLGPSWDHTVARQRRACTGFPRVEPLEGSFRYSIVVLRLTPRPRSVNEGGAVSRALCVVRHAAVRPSA